MLSGEKKKKLQKELEAGLKEEIKLKKAREIITDFKERGGRGVSWAYTKLVLRDAAKTLYVHTRSQTIKKNKKVSESIAKYADKITENAAAVSDLRDEVIYDTTNILDALSHTDGPDHDPEDDDDDFLRALLEPAVRKQKKQTETRIIGAMPDIPKNGPSDDDDEPGGEGETRMVKEKEPGGAVAASEVLSE